jgi:DNA-binding response OmpR family regulator
VLALSAPGCLDGRRLGLPGATDLLPKPFALEELFTRLRHLVRGAGPFSSGFPPGPWESKPRVVARPRVPLLAGQR